MTVPCVIKSSVIKVLQRAFSDDLSHMHHWYIRAYSLFSEFHPPHFCQDTLSFNTNYILQHFTPQPLTAYQFVAAGGVSVSCCLCSQGEEALVLRKCFEGVQRDGELIRVRDTVLLKSGPRKKSLPYVAKISSLWEEPESGRTPTVH